MKRTLQRLLSAAIVALMFAVMSVTPALAGVNYEKTIVSYLSSKSGDTGYGYVYVNGIPSGKKVVKSSIKSSNPKVVRLYSVTNSSSKTEKIWKDAYAYSGRTGGIELMLLKKGTATVSFKVGSKTYKTKVKVLGYSNPVSKLTIAGGKNLASQFKNGANASGKVAKKSGKIVVQAAKGWKIGSVSYSGNNKSWSHSMSGATKATLSIPAKFASGGSVTVSFSNTGTGGSLYVSYRLT